MTYPFEQLSKSFEAFRSNVDAIFEMPSATPTIAHQYCLNVLLATSRLYADYVAFSVALPALYEEAKSGQNIDEDGSVEREMAHRKRFRNALTAFPWDSFSPPLLAPDTLKATEGYRQSLSLHLPEIYEETLQMQAFATAFQKTVTSPNLVAMEIGMDHLGNNHAVFVLPALQNLASRSAWDLD